ncbi:MAG: winged helix-turn-helix transcriptional regulator [Promethearchaeota archaeon]
MSITLDKKDMTILSRLNEDGRITYSQLANELQLTVPTVKSRIEKLTKIGVIHHIGVYLNPHSLTSDSAVIIALKVKTTQKKEFTEHISSLEEVREVFEVLDEYNFLILSQIQSQDSSQVLFEQLLALPQVETGKITILLKEVQMNPHRIPTNTTLLNVNCEYCGKQITGSYETAMIDEVRHYFCCKTCLKSYLKWRANQKNK